MSKKRYLTIFIAIVIILTGTIGYFSTRKEPDSATQPVQQKISIPEEYVEVTKIGVNEAAFTFAVPVRKQDINGNNIRHCIISVSAGAETDGRQPECQEATSDNSFSLEYNESRRRLIVSDPNPGEWGANSGPFRVGCAACITAIEFEGLHTTDGQLLPKKMVIVY